MSDRTQANDAGESNVPAPVSLAEALRALPTRAPPADAWAEMAQRLAREPATAARGPNRATRRAHRRLWPLGIAAALVLAFSATALLRMRLLSRVPQAISGETATLAATESGAGASSVHNAAISTNSHDSASTTGLAALQAHSRSLERWLRDNATSSMPQSARDLAASTEIEDMIGLVDLQLGAVDARDTAATRSLWQRRVALLEDLSALRYSANVLSLRGGLAANDGSANAIVATPAVWKN